MRFGSVCSGIEAATVASAHLGWEAAWFSEIEKFPSAVLAHHYPAVPNHGDMTLLPEAIRSGKVEAPDMLVGGCPCQSFSLAGQRQGLEDARGNLTLTFCDIADAIDEVRHERGEQPTIIFYENVPGILSDKTNAFGCFLAALAGEEEPFVPPGKWTKSGVVVGPKRTAAWRVLDAQYFNLAQRRQRVFVVASARTDIHPAEILLEFGGVRRDSAPSRGTGQGVAGTAEGGACGSVPVLMDQGGSVMNVEHDLVGTLRRETHGHEPIIVGTVGWNGDHTTKAMPELAPCMRAEQGGEGYGVATAFNWQSGGDVRLEPREECANTLQRCQTQAVMVPRYAVRRLTPTECEKLMGFPPGYTNIPWRGKAESPDGPRYKALGNSWAVNCVRWIFDRIAEGAKRAI